MNGPPGYLPARWPAHWVHRLYLEAVEVRAVSITLTSDTESATARCIRIIHPYRRPFTQFAIRGIGVDRALMLVAP